jgi:hypothetical protein
LTLLKKRRVGFWKVTRRFSEKVLTIFRKRRVGFGDRWLTNKKAAIQFFIERPFSHFRPARLPFPFPGVVEGLAPVEMMHGQYTVNRPPAVGSGFYYSKNHFRNTKAGFYYSKNHFRNTKAGFYYSKNHFPDTKAGFYCSKNHFPDAKAGFYYSKNHFPDKMAVSATTNPFGEKAIPPLLRERSWGEASVPRRGTIRIAPGKGAERPPPGVGMCDASRLYVFFNPIYLLLLFIIKTQKLIIPDATH